MQITFTAPNGASLIKQLVDFLAVYTPGPDSSGTPEADPTPQTVSAPTLDDVRAQFSALIQAGKSARAKEILAEIGAAKLSDLQPEHYGRALQMAKEA